MVKVVGIDHLSVRVSDFAASKAFYGKLFPFLGFEVLRIHLQGRTRIVPRDCARREQAHALERSFPEVAAVGNPAIPSYAERCGGYAPRKAHCHATKGISVGTPRYSSGSARRPGVKPG